MYNAKAFVEKPAVPPMSAADQAFIDQLNAKHNKIFMGSLPGDDFTSGTAHCLFKNNWHVVRKNSIGTFSRADKKEANTYGLPEGPPPSFSFALPKVPAFVLKWQISFYREVMRRMNGAEAYCTIMYDPEEKNYFIFVPQQKVSEVSVDWDPPERTQAHPTCLPVLCCHSHNSMPAFFSGTDDKDEKDDMLYMVMGTLDKSPTYSLRASVFGSECLKLDVSEIFEFSEAYPTWESLFSTPDFRVPEEWMECVSIRVSAPKKGMSARSVSTTNPTFKAWNGGSFNKTQQSSYSFEDMYSDEDMYSHFDFDFYGGGVKKGFTDFSDAILELTAKIRTRPGNINWEEAINKLLFELLDDDTSRPVLFKSLAQLLISDVAVFSDYLVDLNVIATEMEEEETAALTSAVASIGEDKHGDEPERFKW